MKRNNKGFTLIELLAVIVILGLLMAIAIPSVTKYITQSRKKTLTTTIGNYIGALTNQVNDMEYIFTASNTIYAVPIECIALERGGTDPFGEWYQANDSYWAYVLVQYDDSTSSYIYGFTFKDSAGYGLYPTTSEKLNENGSQIQTGLNLNRSTGSSITNITPKENWNGFNLDDSTVLVVLEAESEGTLGDGTTTCTLCQKGDNYAQVEEEKLTRPQLLSKLIKAHNTLITASPTLTTSINNSSDASGLYSSTNTNSGLPTYYFRGVNLNNHVKFAGLNWKIVRINEDGTVRLSLAYSIDHQKFNSTYCDVKYMYYSNSDYTKTAVDDWYQTNILNNGYDSYVATGTFCEEAKVKASTEHTSGLAIMQLSSEYTPNFRCNTDGNGKGPLSLKAGLISYDELVFAGSYPGSGMAIFVSNGGWTMSPAGYYSCLTYNWNYGISNQHTFNTANITPVINLNANVKALGKGTSSDPYVVQTN